MDDYSILDAELPTMVVRCNNTLVLRSVITGQHLQVIGPVPNWTEVTVPAAVRQKSQQIEQEYIKALEAIMSLIPHENLSKISTAKPIPVVTERNKSPTNLADLPPCKVQRNYCCTLCSYYTQNPRSHLLHQRDVHGIRLSIHGCQHCQYASRYCQKLKRHIKMVHTLGSTQETTLKNEKPSEDACKNIKGTQPKPYEFPTNNQKTQPPVEQVFKPNKELPCCSKTVNVPLQNPVDVKKDPEAFFVSAYKNQLQKQLEYEQHLKQFAKTFNTEPNMLPNPSEMPKQPNEALLTPTNQIYTAVNKPYPITEENREIKAELIKKRMYSCRKCNYITHIKSRYNKHVKYHSMPMIQCDKCEFRTTYKWNLTRHLRSHHSNGIYKCSVCSFSANMKQSLTSHEVNHHSPPVGRAVGNKPIRKRRCRVGGSDLLSESGNKLEQKNSSISSNEYTNNASNHQSYIDNVKLITESDNFHSNNSTSNENDSNKSEDNIHDPMSREFSDSENSDLDSSESSDMEVDSSGDSSSTVPETLNSAPIHVDADFLSNSLETVSLQLNPRTEEPQSYVSTVAEQKLLQHTAGEFSASTSESNSSVSTLSADENSDLNSNTSCNTSFQSSCDSENDNDCSSGESTISEESFKEAIDKNRNEIASTNAIRTSP